MEPITLPWQKRVFDIVFSVTALLLAAPFILLVATGMILEGILRPAARGPILYRENRVSCGRLFSFYKFRIFTLSALAEARIKGAVIHTKELEHDSAAMTLVGRLLKQVYMDELPQLINILRGDMSVVGPRPTNPESARARKLSGNAALYLVRAGLTGGFQASKGLRLARNQAHMDMEYVALLRNNPWWKILAYDIRVLLQTVRAVIRARGV